MSQIPINPNVVPLLQGFKPYLGTKGQVITDGVLSLISLVTSPTGEEAIRTMSRALTAIGGEEKTFTVRTTEGPVPLSLNLAFVLFLILILLILSGNLLAFSTISDAETDDPLQTPTEMEGTMV